MFLFSLSKTLVYILKNFFNSNRKLLFLVTKHIEINETSKIYNCVKALMIKCNCYNGPKTFLRYLRNVITFKRVIRATKSDKNAVKTKI